MTIFLDPEQIEIVREVLKKNGVLEDVYVFGSRARGDHKKYSDLDLVFKSIKSLDGKTLVQLKTDFEQSSLPITVDFIDWSNISADFQKNIESDLVKFQ